MAGQNEQMQAEIRRLREENARLKRGSKDDLRASGKQNYTLWQKLWWKPANETAPLPDRSGIRKQTRRQIWFWGVLSILVLAAFASNNKSSPSYSTAASSSESASYPQPSPSYAGSGVAEIDRTLQPSERENYARDPSSQGFSDADRDFLREHGLTEEEARAAETVARENGAK